MKFDPIKILEEYDFSNREPNDGRTLSASMFGDDLLRIYYAINDAPKNQSELSAMTLGSLVHLGMEKVVEDNPDWLKEQRIERYIGRWKITGKPDIVDKYYGKIWDYKTGKTYSRKLLKEEGVRNRYIIQLSIYNWLLGGGYGGNILWFMKDENKLKNEPSVVADEDLELLSIAETEKLILDTIEQLEAYGDTLPPECSDLWIRKVEPKAKASPVVKSRCLAYCEYSKHCKYFNDKSPSNMVAKW